MLELKNKNSLSESKLLEFELKYNTIKKKYDVLRNKQKEYELFKIKYNILLEERQEWKKEQKDLLDKITITALTKTNNTVNKNINITTYTRTDEELKTIYEQNLTSSHIKGGISAITKLIVDKVVTNDNGLKMITITDKSRGTARYKLPSGEIVTDNGLTNFTNKNRNILMKKIYSIAKDQDISTQILNDDTTISKGF
jgi:hypothetical protein